MQNKRRERILWLEGVGFSLIIGLGWAAELLRMPHLFFAEPDVFNWSRPLLKTAVVLAVWVPVHLATRKLLARLHQLEEYLLICAWCRKIGHEGDWITTEDFFGSALSTPSTHGICPACACEMKNSVDRSRGAPTPACSVVSPLVSADATRRD